MALVFLYNKEMQSKSPNHFLNSVLPKLEDILFISILIVCLLLGPKMLSIDSDLGRHLALGNYILETQNIPTKDILSHTKFGESRPPYEWLSQILFAVSNKLAGLDGVIFFSGLIIAIAFLLTYKESVKVSQLPILSVVILLLGLAASSVHWLPRPHVFTFLMLHIWIMYLEKIRKNENVKLWQIGIIMLIWANLHGGFIFGFIVWFAYFAGDIWEKVFSNKKINLLSLLKVGGVSLLASIITPDGWGNWVAVLGNNSSYILQNTSETMSPDFHQAGMLPFLLFIGLTIVIPSITNIKLPASQIFLMAGTAMASLLVARNIPLFVIVSIPILCGCLRYLTFGEFWFNLEKRINNLQSNLKSYWFFGTIVILSALMIVKYSSYQLTVFKFNPSVFPVQATNWLKENPQTGNMFNEFNWGGYIEYRLFPSQKVFLDSQTDFYGEALMREYVQIISAPAGWESSLEKYQVGWVIINPNSPLANVLVLDSDWQLLYQDKVAVIYRKSK